MSILFQLKIIHFHFHDFLNSQMKFEDLFERVKLDSEKGFTLVRDFTNDGYLNLFKTNTSLVTGEYNLGVFIDIPLMCNKLPMIHSGYYYVPKEGEDLYKSLETQINFQIFYLFSLKKIQTNYVYVYDFITMCVYKYFNSSKSESFEQLLSIQLEVVGPYIVLKYALFKLLLLITLPIVFNL
mgnify:CR=1 FL=1